MREESSRATRLKHPPPHHHLPFHPRKENQKEEEEEEEEEKEIFSGPPEGLSTTLEVYPIGDSSSNR
jgi:hypothetical protein